MIAKFNNLPEVTCWGTGSVLREFLHVDDLAEAVIFCLKEWRPSNLNSPKDSQGNTLNHLKEETSNKPDNADRASIESERSLELRTRDRERKLLNKIDKALRKIDDGTYGFCEETNKPISIARLKARPIATLSIEAQEMHEKFEKIYKEKEY